jgi:uncharacterized protein YcfJ
MQVCNTATPPECQDVHAGHHTTVACGEFFAGGASGLGALGATALGAGLAGGVGAGIAAGAGAFSSPESRQQPPYHPVSPIE